MDRRSGAPVFFRLITEIADEGGTAQLEVARSGPSPLGEGTVRLRTQGGTAQAGSDYTAVDQMLTFAPGETSKTIDVPIAADGLGESEQSFTAILSSANGDASLSEPTTSTVFIAPDPVNGSLLPPPPPPLAPFTAANAATVPSSRRCRRRGSRLRFRAKAPPGVLLVRTELRVNGRRVANLTGARADDVIRLRVRRRRTRVVMLVHAADGRVVAVRRTYRRCKRRRA
jgi:hypothetical protein